MHRKLLRNILPRPHQLADRWYLRPLRALMSDPALWALHRKAVARAFAMGLFIAALPIPGQVVVAGVIAAFWRVNLPVAVATVFVTNPVTIVPIFLFAYRLGAGILGVNPAPFSIELSFEWLNTSLTAYWQPLLLGCLLLGALAASIGYLAANLAWRAAVAASMRRRRIRLARR
jgi:uncharacterized protein (DUF2062 family)